MSNRKHTKVNCLVSIIIPSYQRFDLLQKCLNAIPDAFGDISYEVILIDNGSPKVELDKFIKTSVLPCNTRPVYFPENKGFPYACNYGANLAHGALLFFLNNDVIMEKGSGEILVRNMDDPAIGVAGMKLLFPSDEELNEANLKHSNVQRAPNRVQHVGLATNIRGQVIHMYLGWSADNKRVNRVRDVYAVTGAALMTRRNLFREVGGFDPIYGAGTYEDVDLCLKVRDKGLNIVVDVCSVGKHYAGATAEKYNMAFPLNQNKQIFEQKWYNKLIYTEWNYS
jgi:GT2 family glycosyltransferase